MRKVKTQAQSPKNAAVAPGVNPLCYTRDEFAAVLRLSVRTVDRMRKAGKIEGRCPVGRLVRIPCAEAERVLNERAKGIRP